MPEFDHAPPGGAHDESEWLYRESGTRGAQRTYRGRVHYVGGVEAQRLRDELADVTADLLRWAATQSNSDHT